VRATDGSPRSLASADDTPAAPAARADDKAAEMREMRECDLACAAELDTKASNCVDLHAELALAREALKLRVEHLHALNIDVIRNRSTVASLALVVGERGM
jgi:hypothetical protein